MEFDYLNVNDNVISLNDIIFNHKEQIIYSGIGMYLLKSYDLNNTNQDKVQHIYNSMCS